MADIRIEEYTRYDAGEMLALYDAVHWTNYTSRLDMLARAYAGSLCALAAYAGDALIGVVRAVGDGSSILYVQDLLVHPDWQRRGVGRRLLGGMLARYPDVHEVVLLTDNLPSTRAFYQSVGLEDARDCGCVAFVKII